jgi:hypothetical protein
LVEHEKQEPVLKLLTLKLKASILFKDLGISTALHLSQGNACIKQSYLNVTPQDFSRCINTVDSRSSCVKRSTLSRTNLE